MNITLRKKREEEVRKRMKTVFRKTCELFIICTEKKNIKKLLEVEGFIVPRIQNCGENCVLLPLGASKHFISH